MITKEDAVLGLKDYCELESFSFQAKFHVTNTPTHEGTKPCGYFNDIKHGNKRLKYPPDKDGQKYKIL